MKTHKITRAIMCLVGGLILIPVAMFFLLVGMPYALWYIVFGKEKKAMVEREGGCWL